MLYCSGVDLDEINVRLSEAKILLKKSKIVNLYTVLGVEKGRHATEAEINTAYKIAAIEWHPDKHLASNNLQAKSKFQEIGNDVTALSSHGCTLSAIPSFPAFSTAFRETPFKKKFLLYFVLFLIIYRLHQIFS